MMLSVVVATVLVGAVLGAPAQTSGKVTAKRVPLPEEGLGALELIAYNGYHGEEHNVTTSDGYILNIIRIPYGRDGPGDGKPRKPVFLQHGLGASCMNWIVNLPSQSLAYVLADAGYDVFLGNVRGNSFSLGHVSLDYKKDKAYWDFSWQDMGAKDLPAMVGKALELNGGYSKLAYVGHSQGTLIAFTHFSADPAWAQAHISHFFALAPVYYLSKVTSPLHLLAPFADEIYELYQLTGGVGSTESKFLSKYITPVCKNEWIYDYVCKQVEFFILGKELAGNLNQTRIPLFFGRGFGGTGIKNLLAFAESMNSGRCQEFSYLSEEKNHDVYKCWEFLDSANCPPAYHVENIKTPMNIFWSDADELADPQDAFRVISEIPHQYRESKLINGYSHVDFLWATNVNEMINDPIKAVLGGLDFAACSPPGC